ncbi:glycosyltransferase family protein [Burkholderia ubonensis]|uniref:glycosyltransferase family protein n=1 Tax=Burkholderia ubonensis TaxID=101571 RepID=UPI0007C7D8ED|nr:glycosyltransferase [Burkholderia ubonensis]
MKRMVVYSHDAYGLGNIRRMLAVVTHIVHAYRDVMVLLITGSPLIHAFQIPPRVDYLKLPSIARDRDGHATVKTLRLSFADILHLRTDVITKAIQDFNPHLILVDKKPFGMANELKPALTELRSGLRRPKMVLLLRDILDEPGATIHEWQSGGYHEAISQNYDQVLVAGDQTIFDVASEYLFPLPTMNKLRYCGYIARPVPAASPEQVRMQLGIDDTPLVFVTVGGGDDGASLVVAYLKGLGANSKPRFTSLLVTGPEMPPSSRRVVHALAARRSDVIVRDFCDDMMGAMSCADLVVAMCGYNTACEFLTLRKNAVVVPRVRPVREQWIRAERLEARGLLSVLHPDGLVPQQLIATVSGELWRERSDRRARQEPRMDGLSRIGTALTELFETRTR